jgi:hypothetical protein
MPDSAKLSRKLAALKGLPQERLTTAIERQAEAVVRDMRAVLAATSPAVARRVEIAWTWGRAPRGAVTIDQVRGKDRASLTVTLYARARQGSGLDARWFEFGTAPRVQRKTGRRTGRIVARPFFFPVYRANRQRVLANLRSTLRRAVRKIDAS